MNPAAIFFGGRDIGQDKLDWAKELGIVTILVDRDHNCAAAKKADYHVAVSRDDIDAIVARCRRISEENSLQLIGLYCGIDNGQVPALVAQGLSIDHSLPDVYAICSDKITMKRKFLEAAVETPRFLTSQSFEELSQFYRSSGGVVIVKPASSSGSRGVEKVTSMDAFLGAIHAAKSHSENNQVVVEEFVQGSSHDLNGMFWRGNFYPAGIMDRLFFDDNNCMSAESFAPSQLSDEQINEGYVLLEKAARAVGTKSGPVKGDFILSENGWSVLEVAPRFHGDLQTVQLMPAGPKVNALKGLFSAWLGHDPANFLTPRDGLSAWKLLLPRKSGIFRGLNGIYEAKQFPEIVNIFLLKKRGDRVSAVASDNTDMLAIVVAAAGKKNDLDEAIASAEKTLLVDVEG